MKVKIEMIEKRGEVQQNKFPANLHPLGDIMEQLFISRMGGGGV